jgi:Trypsin-like peptidase domain
MILRKVIPILFVCSCLSHWAAAQTDLPNLLPLVFPPTGILAQDFNKIVVPITELKLLGLGIEGKFGTGFCLDPECRFIGTNYHVAMMARPRKIKGEKVVQRYLATGPDDEGATVNDDPSGNPMKYALDRDLAIFELRHSLSHHHGVAFSLDELQIGQQVDIYAYPMEGINPHRSLLQFHGTFKGQTTTGLLAFDYSFSAGKSIQPGASGGIVVDSRTQQTVGILNEIDRNGKPIAMAVPVQSLADFVGKVQPYLAQSLFPSTRGIPPVSADLYPKFVLPPPDGVLERRPEEPAEVTVLRSKAQFLADSMRNFIAVQTFAWGSGDKAPTAESAYEVQVLDGHQRFREYPDGKKELRDVPFPALNTVMVPGGEWSELPEMVGTELRLKIHQAADVLVNGQRIKVFQYWAGTEDGVCRWKSNLDLGFFAISKTATVACYGEVWTDEDTNILRISEQYELPGKWKDYRAVVTYGWLRRSAEAPRLIPRTISSQAQYNKKIYWCRGQFTNYQVFSSRVKMAAN